MIGWLADMVTEYGCFALIVMVDGYKFYFSIDWMMK